MGMYYLEAHTLDCAQNGLPLRIGKHRCVIAELFSEGTPIFSLSQMFKYRSGEYDPTPYINKIEDEHIKVREIYIPAYHSLNIGKLLTYITNRV